MLESLIRVGALNALGHPAQLLVALDDALAAGQAAQRDRLTGQVSLFDSGADSTVLERPLPQNISRRHPAKRLRWEKELLGLYLSDHPLGELAGVIGEYVTAYSGELGEELDQQRICVGGVVTEVRKVITKARATMGVATLEDLQGTIEVIVFPKVYEQTEPTWVEDAILLVAGRVDHKGEETVLLADAVWTWEEAQQMGSSEFTRQLGRMDRGRRPMRPVGRFSGSGPNGSGGNGSANGNGVVNGNGDAGPGGPPPDAEPVAAESCARFRSYRRCAAARSAARSRFALAARRGPPSLSHQCQLPTTSRRSRKRSRPWSMPRPKSRRSPSRQRPISRCTSISRAPARSRLYRRSARCARSSTSDPETPGLCSTFRLRTAGCSEWICASAWPMTRSSCR